MGHSSVSPIKQQDSINSLLDRNTFTTVPKPFKSLSAHRLPVAALAISYTPSNASRIYSASIDRSVRIWDIQSGKCLITLLFPSPLHSLVIDPCESLLIAGSATGDIFRVDLQTQNTKTSNIYERADLNGNVDVYTQSNQTTEKVIMTGHSKKVNSLSLSFDGSLLVSGSDDETCIVWDCQSRQALRSFTNHRGILLLEL